MPTTIERLERVELGRPRAEEQAIPRRRSDPCHDGQPSIRGTESDRPRQSGQVGKQVVNHGLTAIVDRQDEHDGTGRERSQHGLRRRWPGDGHRDL